MFKKLILILTLLVSSFVYAAAQSGSQTITYSSSSITFNPTTYLSGVVTLTGNLQTFAIVNGTTSGQTYLMTFCQDATGGRIINSGPNNFSGSIDLFSKPNTCTSLTVKWLNSVWVAGSTTLLGNTVRGPISGTVSGHVVTFQDNIGTIQDSGTPISNVCTTTTGCAAVGFSALTAGAINGTTIGGTVPAPGTFTTIIDSALTAGPTPICPYGTGGSFTTVGCSSGTSLSNTLGCLQGYDTSGCAVAQMSTASYTSGISYSAWFTPLALRRYCLSVDLSTYTAGSGTGTATASVLITQPPGGQYSLQLGNSIDLTSSNSANWYSVGGATGPGGIVLAQPSNYLCFIQAASVPVEVKVVISGSTTGYTYKFGATLYDGGQ